MESSNSISKFKKKKGTDEDTLLFLLRSLIGKRIVVELESNYELNGILETVDDNMTCTLTDIYKRHMFFQSSNVLQIDITCVLGKHIRYVHLPDDLDVFKSMDSLIDVIVYSQNKYKRGVRTISKKSET